VRVCGSKTCVEGRAKCEQECKGEKKGTSGLINIIHQQQKMRVC
jgi:hypothetical protein